MDKRGGWQKSRRKRAPLGMWIKRGCANNTLRPFWTPITLITCYWSPVSSDRPWLAGTDWAQLFCRSGTLKPLDFCVGLWVYSYIFFRLSHVAKLCALFISPKGKLLHEVNKIEYYTVQYRSGLTHCLWEKLFCTTCDQITCSVRLFLEEKSMEMFTSLSKLNPYWHTRHKQ